MNATDINHSVFIRLFSEACEKCFGYPLGSTLSESDCKLLSSKIEEQTGLVIGPKSLRNYSMYVTNPDEGKRENPSVATLDTLARYVLNAPYTTELQRKKTEGHHPYWFQYRQSSPIPVPPNNTKRLQTSRILIWIFIVLVLAMACLFFLRSDFLKKEPESFTDHFTSVDADSLNKRGWLVRSTDTKWWNKKNESPGYLTLYTLRGDNWKDIPDSLTIRNLLYRPISAECFSTEFELTGFVPGENWQQAGILLSEDSTFKGRVIRASLSYNDFFAGFPNSPEIIIQGMSSMGGDSQGKPEEFANVPLFKILPGNEQLVKNNLARFSLKVEKYGKRFRFLYATDPMKDFAFKEAMSGDFDMQPNYIALFATQGLSKTENPAPVKFDFFSFRAISCKE